MMGFTFDFEQSAVFKSGNSPMTLITTQPELLTERLAHCDPPFGRAIDATA
jgi:hypothetical protein